MQFTDIYAINKLSDSIFTIVNQQIKAANNKISYRVYRHKNLTLLVNMKTNEKQCFMINELSHIVDTNLLKITYVSEQKDITFFPLIDIYDDVFTRNVYQQQDTKDNVQIIEDVNDSTSLSLDREGGLDKFVSNLFSSNEKTIFTREF